MANHKSAKKRARQDIKRRTRNRKVRSGVRTAIKKFRTASEGEDAEASGTALRQVESVIRKASSKGVISRSQAARRVSRLTKERNRKIG